MNIDSRVKYYIGAWSTTKTICIPARTKIFKQNGLYWYQGPSVKNIPGFPYHYGTLAPGWWWSTGQEGMLIDFPCLTISADGSDNEGLPALAKVRLLNDPSGGIICPMEYMRHWGPIKEARSTNIPWNKKKETCVWRGVATGFQEDLPPRILCCKTYGKQYNIGLVDTMGRCTSDYLKERMSIPDMLQYKYILSLPGNDKDSGLNWKLASNSLVLMAAPEVESWLMEGLLKPYEHYVPLAADYSDLPQVLDWCQSHETECLQIIANANSFMRQFDDLAVEKSIFDKIKKHYLRNFIFTEAESQ